MTVRARITACSATGRVRTRNEDCIGVGGWLASADMPVGFEVELRPDETLLSVIADGMGGHPGGDVASRIAVETLSAFGSSLFTEADGRAALAAADKALFDHMKATPSLAGMGTTIAGLALSPSHLLHFNLGDSRIYRLFDGYLRQVSSDDTPDAESLGGPRSHRISAYLGGADASRRIEAHWRREPLNPPARWLICSDGLTDMVADSAMEAALAAPDRDAVPAIVNLAMEAGGADNVSVLLISITRP